MTTKTSKAEGPVRPEPVSLHPLTTEQALGALLRTPAASTTLKDRPKKPSRKKAKAHQ
jgi:hypothetical protein